MIKRGERVRHRNGLAGEATADESGGTVVVRIDDQLTQTWSVFDTVPRSPRQFADTDFEPDDDEP